MIISKHYEYKHVFYDKINALKYSLLIINQTNIE